MGLFGYVNVTVAGCPVGEVGVRFGVLAAGRKADCRIRVNLNLKVRASICAARVLGQAPERGLRLRQKATTESPTPMSSVAFLDGGPEPQSLPSVPVLWVASVAFSSGRTLAHRWTYAPNRTGRRWRRHPERRRSFRVSCENQPCSTGPPRAEINHRRQTTSPSVMTPKRGGLRRR
jgi:hypothetical protein